MAFDFFDRSKTPQQWAEYVRNVVYKSGKDLK
jgi:hypothetical protein